MNIGIFCDTFIPEINGVATSVNSLFTLLKKYGNNAYMITTTKEKKTSFKDNVIRIPGLELKSLYGYKASFIFNMKAYRIIKKLNLDIIHINTDAGIGQFGYIVANRLNIASVYTYHTMLEDYTYYATKGYFDRFSKWAVREFTKTSLGRANEIISPSEKTKVYINSIGIDKYVNVVPTGFDFDRFVKASNNQTMIEKIREECGCDKDTKMLLCLGRIAKEKSFDVIIDSYRRYIDTYKDIKTKLVFVGSGPQLEQLEFQAKNLKINKDNIIFLGKVDYDKTQFYYAASDVFLNASISETQGLTFMESMASRCIVLCRFDNNLLGVIDNKVTGFFFLNEDDFKDKLHEVLSMEKEELKKVKDNAYKSIDAFSEKTFYSNIIGVYKRAIRRNW